MRPTRSTRLAALLVALAFVLAPAAAFADGDPASDFLLISDAFFPYGANTPAPNVQAAVRLAIARAHTAGFPLKVAIIGAAEDLGADPQLFAQPQRYATFLEKEISFNKKATLLVVMPQGFGLVNAGPASALTGLSIPPGTGGDRLARAAIPAIGALAARAGHPIKLPAIPSASGSSGGGTPALLTFGAPLAIVLLVAGGAAIRRSRRDPVDDRLLDDDEDGEDEDGEDEAGGGEPDAAADDPGRPRPGPRPPGSRR